MREYERLIGGYAAYTHRMLEQLGSVTALGRLMSEARIQKGLRTLAKAGRLELSFEAVILRHPVRFPKAVVEAAEWRLARARSGDFD
ncbi:hypothetical protein [Sphingosinicella sp.]|uniref:hypothetical protein n=1 Tax=Sphingosinicella sp. TaxID=1917971 RepID=UPI004037EEAD